MDLLKNKEFRNFSHDLLVDGSESFFVKIPEEQFSSHINASLPYPLQSPLIRIDEAKLKSFFKTHDKVQTQTRKEFEKFKSQICGQDFRKHAILPRFMENYIEQTSDSSRCSHNYGFNLQYSHGVLEKFYNGNSTCLLRPNAENNFLINQVDNSQVEIILEWSHPDPILNIQRLYSDTTNKFLIRGNNTLHLTEIDSDLSVQINLKLNCKAGYLNTALNHVNEVKLALMDAKYKLKIFDLNVQKTCLTYTLEEMEIESKPRYVKFDYLTHDMLMVITDKHIRVLDTRMKDFIQYIDVELEDCDMLLNLNLHKQKGFLSNTVYLTSKHSYFIYDIRTTGVDDFIRHNLKSAPCFINYFKDERFEFVTLHSQSPKDKAIFGLSSPYSTPYHLKNLEDTFDKCRTKHSVPVIPNIEKRFNYPITGVEIISNSNEISMYTTNVFGELFQQDLNKKTRSDEPVERMFDWLMELDEKQDEDLNVVHFANAETAFAVDYELNDVDIFDQYEKNDLVHEFLEDENFDYTNWNADTFLEIWGQDYSDDVSLLQSDPVSNKVEDWIERTEFEVDADLQNEG